MVEVGCYSLFLPALPCTVGGVARIGIILARGECHQLSDEAVVGVCLGSFYCGGVIVSDRHSKERLGYLLCLMNLIALAASIPLVFMTVQGNTVNG